MRWCGSLLGRRRKRSGTGRSYRWSFCRRTRRRPSSVKWGNLLMKAWKEAQRIIANMEETRLLSEKYKENPVGFCREVLKERTTVDTERVMESVLVNPVTIARSSTGPGKCVEWNERIPLADGRVVQAGELAGTYFGILAYGDNGEQCPQLAYAQDNGERPVYRITTDHGRQIVRTAEHPLLAANVLIG